MGVKHSNRNGRGLKEEQLPVLTTIGLSSRASISIRHDSVIVFDDGVAVLRVYVNGHNHIEDLLAGHELEAVISLHHWAFDKKEKQV